MPAPPLQLDPERQQVAYGRATRLQAELRYHLRQAESAQAALETLCGIWELDPDTLEPQTQ